MGFLRGLKSTYSHELSKIQNPNPKRVLNDTDYDSWADALAIRDRRGKKELKTTADARRALVLRNPNRWARLEREFRWAQKEMVKLGLNPEDLRFML